VAYKKNVYEGTLNTLMNYDIIININHLKKGTYNLKIMHNDKLIKKTTFKK